MKRPPGLGRLLAAACLVALTTGVPSPAAAPRPAQAAADPELFEKKVRPILAARCHGCHGPAMQMAGLDLSTAAGLRKGSERGPVIVPGDPAASRLLQVVGYRERVKMPPTGKLSGGEIDDLTAWVAGGAPWPESAAAGAAPARDPERFWSFRSVADCQPPPVRDGAWVRSPIDRFVLARLEQAGLEPAAPASKATLLRRVTFDLTGLPPSPEELAAFVADESPEAFARVVDRLLASAHYGEQWGRHWLDVARYADSTGMDEDHPYPHAWRYRDYVVAAFNRDLPFDRFVTEQLAGDLLPEAAHTVVATGFLALGPKPLAQQDRRKMVYDVVDEQIDVTSKAFMGLTVSCARCHDHKFDPIRTRDYYGLASIFASTKSFRNYGRPGSVSYLYQAPLDKAAHAGREALRQAVYAKRIEMERVLAAEEAPVRAGLRAHLADYLEAAWRIEHEDASAADLARARGLDLPVLERWRRYLALPGERPHLRRYRAADRSTIARVAADYQAAYLATAARWDDGVTEWFKNFQEEVRQDRQLPDRPQVDKSPRQFAATFAERDPFFAETSFNDGPFALAESPRVAALRAEWQALEKAIPPEPPMACAVTDEEVPVRQTVFVRGDHNNPGEPVEKGFPPALGGESRPAIAHGSGRLELARWLTRPDHPLTARVIVNRIWQWHFGEGLVRTPNNWGATGERPTHPELLDFLARRFIEGGWSIKALHRLILLSSTYQMSSHAVAEALKRDPANRLWSRFNRRRLTVEELRDGLLAVEGTLDRRLGGPVSDEPAPEAGADPRESPLEVSRRRTLYIPVRRGSLSMILSMFDFGDATSSNEARARTNVAPQALFMLNSRVVARRSRGIARKLLDDAALDDGARVERAYLLALGRKAAPVEVASALAYIGGLQERLAPAGARTDAWQSFCHVLLASNEFVYLD